MTTFMKAITETAQGIYEILPPANAQGRHFYVSTDAEQFPSEADFEQAVEVAYARAQIKMEEHRREMRSKYEERGMNTESLKDGDLHFLRKTIEGYFASTGTARIGVSPIYFCNPFIGSIPSMESTDWDGVDASRLSIRDAEVGLVRKIK